MQGEGFASFAQGLNSLVSPMAIQTGAARSRKLDNLRAIFSMYVPPTASMAPVQAPAQIVPQKPKKNNPFGDQIDSSKFEEDKDDSMQIGDKPFNKK